MGNLGQMPPSSCGGAILLIKILNFTSGQDKFISHENTHILLAFIINSSETKANQSQTISEIITQQLLAY